MMLPLTLRRRGALVLLTFELRTWENHLAAGGGEDGQDLSGVHLYGEKIDDGGGPTGRVDMGWLCLLNFCKRNARWEPFWRRGERKELQKIERREKEIAESNLSEASTISGRDTQQRPVASPATLSYLMVHKN